MAEQENVVPAEEAVDMGLGDVPEELPDDTWAGFVTFADYVAYENGNKRAVKINYKVHMPGEGYHGETAGDFLRANGKSDSNFQRRRLRDRMSVFDIPYEGLNAGELKERLRALKGTAVWFSTKKRGDFVNVDDVKLRDDKISSAATSDPISNISKSSEPDY